MDLAAAIEEIARQHKESLPDIERMSTLPAMFKKKESLRLVAGQSKINRQPKPLEAYEQLETATKMSQASSKKDKIKANRRSVLENATRTRNAE